MGDSLLCTRMPWVPLLLWPLGRLPYSVAHWVWLGLRTAGVIAFIWIWPHNPRWITAMAVSWFLPVMAALGTGQDAICILFWLGVWQRLEPKRPFLSGLAIALCTAKFHLFLLLPVYLIANRKWRVIAGASTGIAALHEQQQKNLVTAALQGTPPEETSRQTMRIPAAQTRTGS